MGATKILIGCLIGLVVLSNTAAEKANSAEIRLPDKIPDIPYDQMTSQLVAQSVMNFAHNLALALDTNEYPNTQIFSPLSVMSALSILQMGSYGNTYNQLNQLFALLNGDGKNGLNSSKIHEEFGWLLEDSMHRINNKSPHRSRIPTEWRSRPFTHWHFSHGGHNNLEDHSIRISNALFIQNGFSLRPDYAYAAQSVYKGEVTPLDFRHKAGASTDYINSWVNQNTLGKIPILFDSKLDSGTNLVVTSVLYFQGFWEQIFYDTDDTKEAFYPDGPESSPVGVTFMKNGGTYPFYHSEEYNCRIIGLPYRGNQTTMYVIQPLESTRLNLQQLQKNLTGEIINELISKMEYTTAILVFPKFHVESKMNLKDTLKRMGIEDIFEYGRADFSLIADSQQNAEEAIAPSSCSVSSWGARPVPVPQMPLTSFDDTIYSPLSGTKTVASSFSETVDRYGDSPLIFSRFGEETTNQSTGTDRPELSEEVETTTLIEKLDDKVEKSETTTAANLEEKSLSRKSREIPASFKSLQRLDELRSTAGLKKPNLYVDDIVHKVNFNINEQGTEAAAATAGTVLRSGPSVVMRCDTPYLILIRHDLTKLPLFYGIVNIPAS